MADPVHAFKADGTPSPGALAALNGKSNVGHTHTMAQVNGLDARLDALAADTAADITGLADALASLTHDSGPLDWTSYLANGWTGSVNARRVGPFVYILFNGITAGEGASSTIFTFPTGYLPVPVSSSAITNRVLLHSTANPPAVRRLYFNDRAIISNSVTGEALYGGTTYLTADLIPA